MDKGGYPMKLFFQKNITSFFIFFYLLIAFVNDGFMGTDEYWNAMVKYLPAQTAKVTTLVDAEDVKSPLQVLPMFLAAQIAWKINIEHPYDQYRFTIIFLTSLSILIYLLSFHLLTKYKNWKNENDSILFIGLMTFYFAASFALTRPMFESLGAPWILLSCGFFRKYQTTNNIFSLILSTLAVSMAFVLRQQTGIGALTIPLLLILDKDYRGFLISNLTGIFAFLISGLPDLFLRGEFHQSLVAVTTYNMKHGHEYGNTTIWFYPIMLVMMSFLPFYFSKKYEKNFISTNLIQQKFSLVFIFFFVLLHSYFPQKFERFLISIIPLVLVVITPFLGHLIYNYKQYKWRLSFLALINLILLFTASFRPSQSNIIQMALYIDRHPEVLKVLNYGKTLEWIPEKFIVKNHHYQIIDVDDSGLLDLNHEKCENILVINEYEYKAHPEKFSKFKIKDIFGVNFIEALSYKLNQKNNIRRSPLIVLGC